jgi:hypothetical protein
MKKRFLLLLIVCWPLGIFSQEPVEKSTSQQALEINKRSLTEAQQKVDVAKADYAAKLQEQKNKEKELEALTDQEKELSAKIKLVKEQFKQAKKATKAADNALSDAKDAEKNAQKQVKLSEKAAGI